MLELGYNSSFESIDMLINLKVELSTLCCHGTQLRWYVCQESSCRLWVALFNNLVGILNFLIHVVVKMVVIGVVIFLKVGAILRILEKIPSLQ